MKQSEINVRSEITQRLLVSRILSDEIIGMLAENRTDITDGLLFVGTNLSLEFEQLKEISISVDQMLDALKAIRILAKKIAMLGRKKDETTKDDKGAEKGKSGSPDKTAEGDKGKIEPE